MAKKNVKRFRVSFLVEVHGTDGDDSEVISDTVTEMVDDGDLKVRLQKSGITLVDSLAFQCDDAE